MTTIERRALYSLLRMNWLQESDLAVEPWQVDDYPSIPLIQLFERLNKFSIYLDSFSFVCYADECDSPEDLTDNLIGDRKFPTIQEDEIYLLIFELWRRLMTQRPSLSTICFNLDDRIFRWNQEETPSHLQALQDALMHFLQILDDNCDRGVAPAEAFEYISNFSSNDLGSFLYDFIDKQIEEGNEPYADELLENFDLYLKKNKWFQLLHLRLSEQMNNTRRIMNDINEYNRNDQDLDFDLDYLDLMVEKRDFTTFHPLFKKCAKLLKTEEDFKDLLNIEIDYFHFTNQSENEKRAKNLLEKRLFPLERALEKNDSDLAACLQLLTYSPYA